MSAEPAAFSVGLDAFEELENHHYRAGIPPVSRARFAHAPYEVERYLGRVEEVDNLNNVIASLWEVPSGRRGTAAFVETTHFDPEPPRVGALLYVWVWSELSEKGEPETKTFIRVENQVLTEEQRNRLRDLLAETTGDGS